MEKFAILIDYENFPCPPEGLARFLADFSQRGALAVKRAYADWARLSSQRQLLLANQVEMIGLTCAAKGKNSADIRLVVDAMELVFTKPHISTFVIASGDADFLPLLSRLREYNKQTIVVAKARNLHTYMQTHCHEFINGDDYLSKPGSKAVSSLAPSRVVPKIPSIKIPSPTSEQERQIRELILEVWQSYGVEQPLDLSGLGSRLRRSRPELDWKDYGFKTLQPLVAYLVTIGFLRIELTNGSSNRIYLADPLSGLCGTSDAETSTLRIGSILVIEDFEALEVELVSLTKKIVHERIPWNVLQERLTQMHPSLLKDMQSEDTFLKLLQSLDARGKIDLQFDTVQKTYFVSSISTDQVFAYPQGYSEANASKNSPMWTQPKLF